MPLRNGRFFVDINRKIVYIDKKSRDSEKKSQNSEEKGQNYRDWQRDQEEVYHYKVEQIKRKLNKRPKHKVLDYWR